MVHESWNARTSHAKAWLATANSSWSNWMPELPRIIRTKALWSSTRSFFNSWWCTRSCLGKWKGGGLFTVSKGTCEDLHQLWLSTYQYRVWWGYKNSKYLITFIHTVSDIRIYIYIRIHMCVIKYTYVQLSMLRHGKKDAKGNRWRLPESKVKGQIFGVEPPRL